MKPISPPSPFTTKSFAAFPEGRTHTEDWGPFKVDGECRVLILADLHIPYHSKDPIMRALEYGRKNSVDTILLNGGVADFYACSFWQNDPKQRNLAEELKTVKAFLSSLRGSFPKARIIFKLGNHEERRKRFIIQKAPEVYGVEEFELKNLLQLANFGAELVEDKRPVVLGKLNCLHGHEFKFAISNPVNPARGLFLRCKAHALSGHFHQSSSHTEKSVEQEIIATWSTGCLANLHPDYLPLNSWCHGFAFVEVAGDGKFEVHNKIIRGGRIY